jgi:hypothetical protein
MMSRTGGVLLVPNRKVEVLGQRLRTFWVGSFAVCLDLLTPTEIVPGVSFAGRGQSPWQVPLHAKHLGEIVPFESLVGERIVFAE